MALSQKKNSAIKYLNEKKNSDNLGFNIFDQAKRELLLKTHLLILHFEVEVEVAFIVFFRKILKRCDIINSNVDCCNKIGIFVI